MVRREVIAAVDRQAMEEEATGLCTREMVEEEEKLALGCCSMVGKCRRVEEVEVGMGEEEVGEMEMEEGAMEEEEVEEKEMACRQGEEEKGSWEGWEQEARATSPCRRRRRRQKEASGCRVRGYNCRSRRRWHCEEGT